MDKRIEEMSREEYIEWFISCVGDTKEARDIAEMFADLGEL